MVTSVLSLPRSRGWYYRYTTTANVHDSKRLDSVLKKVDAIHSYEKGVNADKGYKVPDNDALLEELNLKNRLQHRAYRNRPLTSWEAMFNKLIAKKRYVVERTFGGIKKWFRAGVARYKGVAKTHVQHVLEEIAYNLKRAPGIIVSYAIQKS